MRGESWIEGRGGEEDEEDMRAGGIADARKASEGSNEKSGWGDGVRWVKKREELRGNGE